MAKVQGKRGHWKEPVYGREWLMWGEKGEKTD